ncbi:MAG: HAD family hydrolase [Bryobacteraceae bacterium]
MSERVLVFDMDGVLVDVSESYRETIQRTVQRFTGRRISREAIQKWKNRGGWNDDWALSNRLIREHGVEVEYQTVVDYFQSIFHGGNHDGLVLRERWIARDGLLDRLSRSFRFALFTGRLKWEAEFTLHRFAPQLRFDPIVGAGEVARHKPAPDGLLHIRSLFPGASFTYIGDTVDDARCARAAETPFVGIASLGSPRREELVALLQAEEAVAVLEDINGLETVLAQGAAA